MCHKDTQRYPVIRWIYEGGGAYHVIGGFKYVLKPSTLADHLLKMDRRFCGQKFDGFGALINYVDKILRIFELLPPSLTSLLHKLM